MFPPAYSGTVRHASFSLSVLALRSLVASRKSTMGKSVKIRGTSSPTSNSLPPSLSSTSHAHVSPPITGCPSVVPRGRGPLLTLIPNRFCGVPVVNRQLRFPVSKNTLAALYSPGMLQKRNNGGLGLLACASFVQVSSGKGIG